VPGTIAWLASGVNLDYESANEIIKRPLRLVLYISSYHCRLVWSNATVNYFS
jgi:hypothetical protein